MQNQLSRCCIALCSWLSDNALWMLPSILSPGGIAHGMMHRYRCLHRRRLPAESTTKLCYV